jgi:hypothetical protein
MKAVAVIVEVVIVVLNIYVFTFLDEFHSNERYVYARKRFRTGEHGGAN